MTTTKKNENLKKKKIKPTEDKINVRYTKEELEQIAKFNKTTESQTLKKLVNFFRTEIVKRMFILLFFVGAATAAYNWELVLEYINNIIYNKDGREVTINNNLNNDDNDDDYHSNSKNDSDSTHGSDSTHNSSSDSSILKDMHDSCLRDAEKQEDLENKETSSKKEEEETSFSCKDEKTPSSSLISKEEKTPSSLEEAEQASPEVSPQVSPETLPELENEESLPDTAQNIFDPDNDSDGEAFMNSIAKSNPEDLFKELKKSSRE